MTSMPLRSITAAQRHLLAKAQAIAAMRREDYADAGRFRSALSNRTNGLRRLIQRVEQSAEKLT